MFKTIKTRIIVITLSMLIVLSILTSALAFYSYVRNKALKIETCNLSVISVSEKINRTIQILQNNVEDLSLMGAFFHYSSSNHEFLNSLVKDNFYNNDEAAIGGGIWFEPYKTDKYQERFCSYAYKKDGKIILDKDFETIKYNYLSQLWYKTIKENSFKINDLTWTKPYFDEMGTKELMTTVGAGIFDKQNDFIGMATVDWKMDSIIDEISDIKPTKNSFILFADKNYDFILAISDENLNENDYVGKSLKTLPWYNSNIKNKDKIKYNGVEYISFIKNLDNNMFLMVNVPTNELFASLNLRLRLMMALLILTCFAISGLMYYLLKRNINKPIGELIKLAKEIGNGNLEKEIKIESPEEFAILASSFNKMTTDVKNYITNLNVIKAEKEKFNSELSIAKSIQHSILPNTFPPYPHQKEFEIFATMETAKDVGGDFYDFFFIDPDHFAYLIADVSGKGIPAALFMMTTKTMIKNLAKTNISPEELMTKINKKICKTNKEGFFVTVFLCIVELSTGKLVCMNAGHNPPLLKRANERYEYLKCKPNLVIGAMDMIEYKSYETMLQPNDCMFLYTDGITEAFDNKSQFYGTQRLSDTINSIDDTDIQNVLHKIKADVEEFSQGEEQADDMTMLIFKYNGADSMKEDKYLMPAKIENLSTLINKIEDMCNKNDIPQKAKMKLHLAVEEIFTNISTYAYPPKEGDVEVIFKIDDEKITVEFADYGKPYNPLEKPDPDVTLSADERPIGGLGIYLVKNTMNSVDYEFIDNKNILTITLLYKE